MGKPARETGTLGLLSYLQSVAADTAYRVGDWDAAAQSSARQSRSLSSTASSASSRSGW